MFEAYITNTALYPIMGIEVGTTVHFPMTTQELQAALSTLINTLFPKMTAPQLICGGIAILACSLLVYVLSYPLTVSIFKKKEY